MIREYDEDEEHDSAVQFEVDEATEAKSLLDAFVDGRDAGRMRLSGELNPHPAGSQKHKAWERGRMSTINGDIYGR